MSCKQLTYFWQIPQQVIIDLKHFFHLSVQHQSIPNIGKITPFSRRAAGHIRNFGHFTFTLASQILTWSCVNLFGFTWLNDRVIRADTEWRLSDSMHLNNRPFWFRSRMVPLTHCTTQEWSRVIWGVDTKGNVDSPSHHHPSHLNRRISRTTHSKNWREYE